ncbi:acyltransferase family protein [Aggregatibacter kilianii]|uniref:acyltransferase family protein n=1 Tax=Aggregatibacter kilianii TaxID=2025884 RepID=UPI000D64904B|nr:acyltransferase [Aggregatibacter kilianii]
MKSLNFKYLSRLDHLRFFACLLVLFHHFRGDIISSVPVNLSDTSFLKAFVQLWLMKGASGVSLFLVLSAFLFTLITNAGGREIIYHKFIYNRILRIFPLVVFLVFVLITIDRANSTPMDIFRLITLQLNTGNPMTGWGNNIFPSGPIWTIAVEFQFYLLFPILILFFSKYGIRYLMLVILFMLFLRWIVSSLTDYNIYYNLYHTIIGRLDQFIVGIVLGALYIRGTFDKLSNVACLFLIFFSILTLSLLFISIESNHSIFMSSVLSFPLEALGWGIIIIAYLKINIKIPYSVTLDKTLAFLGGLSFSIYLFHLPVGFFANNVLGLSEPSSISQSMLFTLVRLPIILIFSIITYYAIEKPFMELRVKYFKE